MLVYFTLGSIQSYFTCFGAKAYILICHVTPYKNTEEKRVLLINIFDGHFSVLFVKEPFD